MTMLGDLSAEKKDVRKERQKCLAALKEGVVLARKGVGPCDGGVLRIPI